MDLQQSLHVQSASSSQPQASNDYSSESYAVNRITIDRLEVLELLQNLSDDTRVVSFIQDYDSYYERLTISDLSRIHLRKKVRELKATGGVSTAKAKAVDDIFKCTDEHIAELKREVNRVYHRLIEAQEAEDVIKDSISSLYKDMKAIKLKIEEREEDEHTELFRQMAEASKRYEECTADRDKVNKEVERLREELAKAAMQSVQLEKSRLRLEAKTEETEQDFIRVDNDIAKARSKKSRLAASLEAATEQLKSREEDMEDIRQHLEDTTEECKTIDEAILATTVKKEKLVLEMKMLSTRLNKRQFEYERQTSNTQLLETEIDQLSREYKKKQNELDAMKELTAHVDKARRAISYKVKEADTKKEKVLRLKDKQKKRNMALMEEIEANRRKAEMAVREQTSLLKQRDWLRKKMMKLKATTQKERVLLLLHQLANKRLTQDNAQLRNQCQDQGKIMSKLEQERDGYARHALGMAKKSLKVSDHNRRMLEKMFEVMSLVAMEEMKMLESQNLYEATRNEHALYTRHILQLRELINNQTTKCKSMCYETYKLIQERDYRDDCLLKEALALQKLSRQNFILKANLKDLKESNARTKMMIENQDIEEKKLEKMTRVMKAEARREMKGLEWVIRDVDGLDLALNRRFHELQDLYTMIKLKQSMLEKAENCYRIRWKEHMAITANLKKTKALRKLDQKHRNTINELLDCVKFFEYQLEKTQERNKGLIVELGHPCNIHRWRHLLGRDPDAYASIRMMHKVRRQIQEKVEMTLTTTGKIHILDREYIGLTTSVLMQPSPETVLQLKLYKQDLDTRYLQIKTLTKELREALDDKTDMSGRHDAVRRKLTQIRKMWIQHMSKEKKRVARQQLQLAGPMALLSGPEGLPPWTQQNITVLRNALTYPAPAPAPAMATPRRPTPPPCARITHTTPVPSRHEDGKNSPPPQQPQPPQ